jgi:Fe-S cluster assembly ATP-binding protein
MSPEDRAREGIFMAFQYPVEIPGVSNLYFLKAALNAIRKHQACRIWTPWISSRW